VDKQDSGQTGPRTNRTQDKQDPGQTGPRVNITDKK